MNFHAIEALFLVIVSVSILATTTHASFCSSISCTCNGECVDKCDGGYWYYGNGTCSADCCPPPSPMHCQYSGRVCADNDSSDNFPKIGCQVVTCNAECDQNTDCKCPESGCVGNDYYDYQGVCNESCECNCETNITYNDSRCVISYIELNKTVNPEKLTCQNASVTLYAIGVGAGTVGTNINVIDFLPAYVDVVNLPENCSYENETRKITCSLDNLTAGETKTVVFEVSINHLGIVPIDVYPDSGINYTNSGNATFVSFPETYVNVSAYPGAVEVCSDGIDNNCNGKIDCNDPTCATDPACVKQPSNIGGGGGSLIGGGYATITTVCGNNKCEYGETCSSCPKDCLKNGQVCCGNIAYNGSCCVDADCGNGYECNITKMCNPISVTENVTQPIKSGCEESWVCTDWSNCENGVQTRRCIDKNSCGTTFSEPEEVRKCTTAAGITGFSLLNSPDLLVFIASLVILLFLFLWKRRKEKS
jgi:hypothetical protein